MQISLESISGHHLRTEKKSCRSEKWISLVGLRNIKDHLLWFRCMVLRLSIRLNRTNGEHHSRPRKRVVDPKKEYHKWGLEILLRLSCGWGIAHSLSIRSNRTNGEWHSRPEKNSCRSEKWISFVQWDLQILTITDLVWSWLLPISCGSSCSLCIQVAKIVTTWRKS